MNKRILTLQDFSSIGRCSLTSAIPVLFAAGHEAVALPTALYSTQTAIPDFTFKDLSDFLMPAYNHFKKIDIKFDCLYTGFLGTISAVNSAIEIATDLKSKGTLIAIDPAMADNGSLYVVFDNDYYQKMLSLVNLADILMPNFTEGKMLANIKEDLQPTKESAVAILKNLKKQGFEKVVLSGIADKDKCGTATLYNGEITFQFNKRFDLNIHGAGDVLSSVFLATLLKGNDFCKSVQKAVDFVHDCIDLTVKEGHNLKYGLVIERFLSYL